MLEFNNEHKKAKINSKEQFTFKKILIPISIGLVTISLAGAIIFGNPKLTDSKSLYISDKMQKNIQKADLNVDLETMLLAQKIDYYESIDSAFERFDSNKLYSEHISSNSNVTPTFDDFKKSVEQTITNVDYMSKKGKYIAFSEEEINNLKREMFSDYDIINQYIEKNKSDDYEEFYNKVLFYKIQIVMQKNNIENFSLNDITIHDEDKNNEYAELDLTINGANTKIFAGDYLFSIFKNMDDNNKEEYIKSINNLILGKFDINMESKEINNYTKKKGDVKNSKSVVIFIIFGWLYRKLEEEDKELEENAVKKKTCL